MCLENAGNKITMAQGKGLDQIDTVAFLTFALKPVGHNQINAIGLAPAMIVDPGEFFAQLLGRITDRTKHSHTPRTGYGSDHVPAMAKGQ